MTDRSMVALRRAVMNAHGLDDSAVITRVPRVAQRFGEL